MFDRMTYDPHREGQILVNLISDPITVRTEVRWTSMDGESDD